MTILNEKTNEIKAREVKNVSCIYITKGEEDTELLNDIILVGNLSHNTILKSLKFTSSDNLAGFTADVILLNKDKEEITYESSGTKSLSPLVNGLDFSTALTGTDKITPTLKLETLEEYIIGETGQKNYTDQVFVALKIKTAPTTATADVKILAEIDFIENI